MILFSFLCLYLIFLIYALGGFNDIVKRNQQVKDSRRKWMKHTNKED